MDSYFHSDVGVLCDHRGSRLIRTEQSDSVQCAKIAKVIDGFQWILPEICRSLSMPSHELRSLCFRTNCRKTSVAEYAVHIKDTLFH